MTNGTVTMSLADVDNLRNTIKEKEQKVSELEKQVQEIKAEKRVLKITNEIIKYESALNIIQHMDRQSLGIGRYDETYRSILSRIKSEIQGYEYRYNSHISGYNQDNITTKEEYLNFEDVKEELRSKIKNEVESGVYAELGELRIFRQNILKEQETYKAKVIKEKEELISKHREQIDNLNKQIDKLNQDYYNLEHDKKEKKVEEELRERLKEVDLELRKLKALPWYKRIFI
jgi:cell division protein FtsL